MLRILDEPIGHNLFKMLATQYLCHRGLRSCPHWMCSAFGIWSRQMPRWVYTLLQYHTFLTYLNNSSKSLRWLRRSAKFIIHWANCKRLSNNVSDFEFKLLSDSCCAFLAVSVCGGLFWGEAFFRILIYERRNIHIFFWKISEKNAFFRISE